MPLIPVLGKLRQEDLKFEDSLGYTIRATSPRAGDVAQW
jgi:hypothetical protein